MKEIELKYKRIDESKLSGFGFVNGEYSESILNGQFELKLVADKEGRLFSSLVETAVGDEYVLHLVPEAQGEFVGAVKAAYNSVIERFIKNCCEREVFKSRQSHEIIAYARNKYGDDPEYLWNKFPDNAVLRRKDTASWYAALLTVSRAKFGFESKDTVEVIDLRIRPENLKQLVDGKIYFPGYHMNKKSWLTIILDGSVPTAEIFERIDESYRLAGKK